VSIIEVLSKAKDISDEDQKDYQMKLSATLIGRSLDLGEFPKVVP